MKDIIIPDIKMIYDISEEYRQDPIYWALYLSVVHCVVKNYSMDAQIIKQMVDEGYNGTRLIVLVKSQTAARKSLGFYAYAKEVGKELYIKVVITAYDEEFYYHVKANSLFESIGSVVVTDESFNNDVGLVKSIKFPSKEIVKLFEEQFKRIEDEEVEVKHKIDKSKLDTSKAKKVFLELSDVDRW